MRHFLTYKGQNRPNRPLNKCFFLFFASGTTRRTFVSSMKDNGGGQQESGKH
jgi:hypothetical protein